MQRRRNPPLVHEYPNRHGTIVYYLRRLGHKKVRLRIPEGSLPWSPAFMAVYEAALSESAPAPVFGAGRTKPGTVNAALIAYYQSSAFRDELGESTQKMRRAILERFREICGDFPVATMSTSALQRIFEKKSPAARRNWLKAIRGFAQHAIALGSIKNDPTIGVRLGKMKVRGHHTWTDDEVEQYKARHAIGSRARLALELLLHTGHARADVVRMGRQHVKNGVLSMRRQKSDTAFHIPLLPDLRATIDALPPDQLHYLTTEFGRPFTAAGFGNWFREQCDMANLRHCSSHGLRKAAATRHAENGATAPELMAWFGWKTLAEPQRYIDEANRKKLARNSGDKVIAGTSSGSPPNPVSQKAS